MICVDGMLIYWRLVVSYPCCFLSMLFLGLLDQLPVYPRAIGPRTPQSTLSSGGARGGTRPHVVVGAVVRTESFHLAVCDVM